MLSKATVCVIGSGAAGLITAHTLLYDHFDVQILTRDSSPGGVWSAEKNYPGLRINNVHGEFNFSALPMPVPKNGSDTGGRLTGEDMLRYMQRFSNDFLCRRIHYRIDVQRIRRDDNGRWVIQTVDLNTNSQDELFFDKLVLCTGGCCIPFVPSFMSPHAAEKYCFDGVVLHTAHFGSKLNEVLSKVNSRTSSSPGRVVVVGGGRSSQDVATYLANQNLDVTIVFDVADAILAVPIPLPDFIRKSRLLGIFSPHIMLRTRLERFLHTTRIGSFITRSLWKSITWSSFKAFAIPSDSPLRRAQSLFWGVRTNDEGIGRRDGRDFHKVVNAGLIDIVAPARVSSFGDDGRSVVLDDGRSVRADAVILGTGYTSSWDALFDEPTKEDIGLASGPVADHTVDEWNHYTSLQDPPPARSKHGEAGGKESHSPSSIYRGLVPAKNILKRDFAVNGAFLTTNNGYTYEVSAHWISSYFLADSFLKIPSSPEEALAHSARNAAWLRKRYPGMLNWANESYSSNIAFWSWPQAMDELLEDMSLPSMRSGGNWFTFPFKVISVNELKTLGAERAAKRRSAGIQP
ncbi:FAD/NAD-P-binding domain-containing protein [Rickenella mellea]|uniref:FAD/NAD-P-binding domain-containing protein n=1 Tax=Rickenella mellea TaxID=50990 RepID=A0A4Y7Q699_9AGAM|nr:FAD/NAD-P-binding domain-containing protein [Rickenella mellea]